MIEHTAFPDPISAVNKRWVHPYIFWPRMERRIWQVPESAGPTNSGASVYTERSDDSGLIRVRWNNSFVGLKRELTVEYETGEHSQLESIHATYEVWPLMRGGSDLHTPAQSVVAGPEGFRVVEFSPLIVLHGLNKAKNLAQ